MQGSVVLNGLRTGAVVITCSLFSILFPVAASAGEAHVYGAVSSFTWEEFEDNGSKLLKESGPLFGIGYGYRTVVSEAMTLQPGAELFFGNVDYDGRTQSGVPVQSSVDYLGLRLKFELGGLVPLQNDDLAGPSLEPFAGIGVLVWKRDINNATAANGTTAVGYREDWTTVHLRLGLRGRSAETDRMRIFGEAGLKLPVFNRNTARLSNAGLGSDVTMRPGNELSFFAEGGLQSGRVRASVFYDGMRFSRSNDVVSGSFVYHQPRSTSDLIGVKLGGVF